MATRASLKKNPVNIDRYGDLFYDAAAELDEIVIVTMGEVFEGDEAMGDPEMISTAKLYKAKMAIGAGIIKAWVRMQKGRKGS